MFTINAKALLAVLPHRSTDERRPTLNGICCSSGGILVATDGQTLAAYNEGHTATEPIIFAVPKTGFAVPLKKAAKRGEAINVYVHGDPTDRDTPVVRIDLGVGGVTFATTTIEGPFPDWRQILPNNRYGLREPAAVMSIGVDTTLVARFGEHVRIQFYGAEHAMVVRDDTDDNFYGVLMPRRMLVNGDTEQLPGWLSPAVAEAKEKVRAA